MAVPAAGWVVLSHPEITPPSNFHQLRDTTAPSEGGRAGGELARKIGTRDEKKRHDDTSAGTTRETDQDKNDSGDKEKV